jgi:hypothetical protein
MFIRIIYTWKLCTQLSCLNNVWYACLNNIVHEIIKIRMDLEQTHEAYKFVIWCTDKLWANADSQDSPRPEFGGMRPPSPL